MGEDIRQAQDAIEAVARFMEREFLTRSSFHLSACGGCGAPTFQQPCPICGYYPMGRDKGTWSPTEATKDHFHESIDRSGPDGRGGNIATWCAAAKRDTVWGRTRQEAIDGVVSRGALLDLPRPDLLWRLVVVEGRSLSRTDADPVARAGWQAIGDIVTCLESANRRGDLSLRTVETIHRARRTWVDAIHSGVGSDVVSALDALEDACRLLSSNGNRSAALESIDRARNAAPTAPNPIG